MCGGDDGEKEEASLPPIEEENGKLNLEIRKKKRKKRLMKEAGKADKRGVCYLSHIPPKMDPLKLRQLLSQYGDIERIYLIPENPDARLHRKRAGGFRGQRFSEGWVEFTNKRVGKEVAEMLNGEQIGGKKRSIFYFDRWNIKYLSKFKWDDLTDDIAYKSATWEQKQAMDQSTAKRERDFYLSKVDKSNALKHIDERLQKKQKILQESGAKSEIPDNQLAQKVVRQVPQTRPVADQTGERKRTLSKAVLAGVFGGSA